MTYNYEFNLQIFETFNNHHMENDYFVKFNIQEFMSLCSMTSQLNFAMIFTSYILDIKILKRTLLNLYICSFRNHDEFYDDCTNTIMEDLIKLMILTLLKYGRNLPQIVVFRLINIVIMKKWLKGDCLNISWIYKK